MVNRFFRKPQPARSGWSTVPRLSVSVLGSYLTLALTGAAALAQNPATPPPVDFTAEQDQQNMMNQLGIKALRPGPSGDEKAPNHANYDESKANPYPSIPDPLSLNDGGKVTTPALWWDRRRPELIEMFEKYVYGRIPASVPKVTWSVTATDHEMVGFTPVVVKDLIGQVDNSVLSGDFGQDSHDTGDPGWREGTGPGSRHVRSGGIPVAE